MNDDLTTRPIPGVDRYHAHADGQIIDAVTGRTIKPYALEGAMQVKVVIDGVRQSKRAHLLICTAFHGERPGPRHQVIFKNNDWRDLSASNLCWGKLKRTGLQGKYGTASPSHRLTEEQATEALARMAKGESSSRVAESYGVISRTIRFLAAGKTWPHLPRPDALRHRTVRPVLPRIAPRAA